jgi:hypothetical protein
MTATKERHQNPVINDSINLRLFFFNSNARYDPYDFEKVEIYFLDPWAKTEENPDGRTLVQTILPEDISKVEDGQYLVTITAESCTYHIGNYLDIWHTHLTEGGHVATYQQCFTIYPDLVFTSSLPVVYDFTFDFRPNRMRQGSIKYLEVDVTPNVPTECDAVKYYTMLAISSNIKISIEISCAECMPQEEDLRLIIDEEDVVYRDMGRAFYLLDSTDMDCGIYNVFFTMTLGESKYISDKMQLQIY